jgi:transposase-like protein
MFAFAAMCSAKKGISALQLQRQLELGSYRTAWFMCHRIRHAMKTNSFDPLVGAVEVDETYVGGKPRKGTGEVNKRGRGTKKVPVVALVERSGRVRSRVITDVTAKTLKSAIRDNVSREATIITDELSSYKGIGKEFEGGHKTVNHGEGEYARNDGTNTNTVESYFALIKRGVYGNFHHVSRQHLQRYCDEFSFRWDHRSASDMERTVTALRQSEGKRLMYS